MSGNRVQVTAEWALWGVRPGERDGDILACSDGPLRREHFLQILARYGPGTLEELPQVVVAPAGSGDGAYLTLAVHESSGEVDGAGRPTRQVRLFCVPYARLAEGPVSYEALYTAFEDVRPSGERPLQVEVATAGPADLNEAAGRVTEREAATAVLLLTRRQLCVVRAESLSLRERLRFLDTVAWLLPYGMRSRLSVSTLTGSTTVHRIRLSFTLYASGRAHAVPWDGPVEPPPLDGAHLAYQGMLGAADLGALVRALAGSVRPLPFEDEGQIMEAVQQAGRRARPEPPAESVADLLEACADAVEQGRFDAVETTLLHLHFLGPAAAGPDRDRYQEILLRRGLLDDRPGMPGQLRRYLLDVTLRLAFGPPLTVADVERIAGAVRRPSPYLYEALHRLPARDPQVAGAIETRLGPARPYRPLGAVPGGGPLTRDPGAQVPEPPPVAPASPASSASSASSAPPPQEPPAPGPEPAPPPPSPSPPPPSPPPPEAISDGQALAWLGGLAVAVLLMLMGLIWLIRLIF